MSHTLRTFFCFGALAVVAIYAAAQDSPAASADQVWADLAAGNKRFVLGKTASHDIQAQRKALAKTQHPRAAAAVARTAGLRNWSSRGLGDLFVVRSAGEDDDPLALGSVDRR